jgi:GNAT superfamily N-acetyltransferase
VEIRPVRLAEYQAVGDLTVAAYDGVYPATMAGQDEVRRYEAELRDVAGRVAGAEVLVAVDGDGGVLGAVTYVPDASSPLAEFDAPDAAGIRMLAVAPAAQGRGVGEALTRACIDRATSAGRAALLLDSTEWMTTAHRLYGRLGFERAPELDWEVGPGLRLRAFRLPLR